MTLFNIIHGPEIWLAASIWACGAITGICVMLLAWWMGGNGDD